MKEKFLLSVGVVFVLFGVIGVCAVGFAYYYTRPYLDELPLDIEAIFAVANYATNDVSAAIYSATIAIQQLALDLEDISILGYKPLGSAAARVRELAPLVQKVGGDVEKTGRSIQTWKYDILPQISLIRFTIEMSFGWIGVLHALFIMMGASTLWIRKRLQSVINRNRT